MYIRFKFKDFTENIVKKINQGYNINFFLMFLHVRAVMKNYLI